jgi:catechol 2,3-dioxygenase-like lactoylglutathione lyase family enzyme
MMRAAISYITLGVTDLARSVSFYRDVFGWATAGIVGAEFSHGAVAFFKLEHGLTLALWPRSSIAADAGIGCGEPDPCGLLLAHNVASALEVDQLMSTLAAAGATIHKPAQPLIWGGYGGLIADPDGHLWEIVYNPSSTDVS